MLSLNASIPWFDPRVGKVTIQPIWVKLLALPLEFWNDHMLMRIGNSIGGFPGIDERTEISVMKIVEFILVRIDLELGLPKNVEVVVRS